MRPRMMVGVEGTEGEWVGGRVWWFLPYYSVST